VTQGADGGGSYTKVNMESQEEDVEEDAGQSSK